MTTFEEKFVVLNITDEAPPIHDVSNFLDTYIAKDVKNYCLSFETSDDGFQHFHLYITTSANTETWRQRFKREFEFRCRFSKENVRDRVRAIAYTLKDGNFVQRNVNVHDFLTAIQISHPKRKKFEAAMREIDEEFIAGKLSEDQYIHSITSLYRDYRRKTYIQHIVAHITTVKMEQSSSYQLKIDERIKNTLSYNID